MEHVDSSGPTGNHTLEHTNCIFCGSGQYKAIFTKPDFRYHLDDNAYTMNLCLDCEGHFLSPRIKEQYIHRYYPGEFYFDQDDPAEIWAHQFDKNRKKYFGYLSDVKPGRLLDFGCRDGSFLRFAGLFGWTAEGFEYDTTLKNPFNCNIHYGDAALLPHDTYDVITLWAVLEHLYRPNDYLELFHDLLKPDGLMIIQVPKYNSLLGRLFLHDDVPRHVSAYTSKWLPRHLERFGFNVERINTRCDVFYGSSAGLIEYFIDRFVKMDHRRALRSLCYVQRENRGGLQRIDRWLAKGVDPLLKGLDYWSQMTVVARKAPQRGKAPGAEALEKP